jgi:hypothetical protein
MVNRVDAALSEFHNLQPIASQLSGFQRRMASNGVLVSICRSMLSPFANAKSPPLKKSSFCGHQGSRNQLGRNHFSRNQCSPTKCSLQKY